MTAFVLGVSAASSFAGSKPYVSRARELDGRNGSDRRMCHRHDLVARADPDCAEGEVDRVRPVRHTNRVGGSEPRRELFFEGFHLGTEHIHASGKNARDGLVDGGLRRQILRRRIGAENHSITLTSGT